MNLLYLCLNYVYVFLFFLFFFTTIGIKLLNLHYSRTPNTIVLNQKWNKMILFIQSDLNVIKMKMFWWKTYYQSKFNNPNRKQLVGGGNDDPLYRTLHSFNCLIRIEFVSHLHFNFDVFWKLLIFVGSLFFPRIINSIIKYSNASLFLAGTTVKFSSRRGWLLVI